MLYTWNYYDYNCGKNKLTKQEYMQEIMLRSLA